MRLIKIIIPCLLLNACLLGTSKNAKFYAISAVPTQVVSEQYKASIGINRVQLPKYMDRPQIVTQRKNSTQVNISEFNRWVEGPAVLSTRALAENLNTLLPAAQINQTRFKGGDFSRTVTVEITKMSAVLGEQAALVAWCTIKGRGEQEQIHQRFEYAVPVGKTYDDLVQAYNQLLADLSHDIATILIK